MRMILRRIYILAVVVARHWGRGWRGLYNKGSPTPRGMILALNHGITWPADLAAIITRLVHVTRDNADKLVLSNRPRVAAFYYVSYVGI